MTLDATTLKRIRRKIGDTGDPQAFSDQDIEDTYEEQGEHALKTVVALLDEVLVSTARFTDYTQNASSEKKSQVFDHLLKMRAQYKAQIDEETEAARAARQVIIARPIIPGRDKDKP